MTGEETQEAGRIGARRAKKWLEATTRANAPWVNPVGAAKLKFPWANASTFSFDLGGLFRGEELEGLEFLAESKYYHRAYDQNALYREYLAKCYRAFSILPQRCDVFLWITWSPFMVTRWDEIRTPEFVRECVRTHQEKVFGVTTSDGEPDIDEETCKEVSKRTWLVFLSTEQEQLVPTKPSRQVVEAFIVGRDD
ncbi:hypothetical protein [Planomonospora parontospora]|uniref:hypothetical protein n=1 Tax=Planomonospora parontospora TaxID=58119 RepID=UPI00167059B5|nr:hypothetical protein [Planomonospora parontospora]